MIDQLELYTVICMHIGLNTLIGYFIALDDVMGMKSSVFCCCRRRANFHSLTASSSSRHLLQWQRSGEEPRPAGRLALESNILPGQAWVAAPLESERMWEGVEAWKLHSKQGRITVTVTLCVCALYFLCCKEASGGVHLSLYAQLHHQEDPFLVSVNFGEVKQSLTGTFLSGFSKVTGFN